MTRINCIPVEELHDKHLLAEYRELPRVFSLAHASLDKGTFNVTPQYTMGTGHVKFFYDKLVYLATRHIALCDEMERRGMTANLRNFYLKYTELLADDTRYRKLWNNWEPTEEAMAINRARISERLKAMTK